MEISKRYITQGLPGMGPGPVLGGTAGGQDYSLSSMLERAPQRDTKHQGTPFCKRADHEIAIGVMCDMLYRGTSCMNVE